MIVQPETVVRWHRQGFRLYWRWKSRSGQPGRPKIEAEVRALIRRMCDENPTWGAPRIQSELALLGHQLADNTVAKYMVWHRRPTSQTWRTFLDNHVPELVGIDFFTVPTVTFRDDQNTGDRRGPDCAALTLAESVLREGDRFDPPRVPKSRHRA